MEIKDLLPIGSVVLLEGGKKRVMIYGVRQIEQETQEEYDYIGQGSQFVFNHDKIQEVFFKGYEDEERQDFIQRLSDYYAQK